MTLSEKIPLEGEELARHREEQAALQKQKLEEERRAREQLGAVKAEEEERVAELEAAQVRNPSFFLVMLMPFDPGRPQT